MTTALDDARTNGYLIDAIGDPIGEDHPEILAEIDRRGWAVYNDHGGIGPSPYGPVVGCDHTANK